jgi:hypothetical protein
MCRNRRRNHLTILVETGHSAAANSTPAGKYAMPTAPSLIIIKRYARSRLYDAAAARYVSVEQLRHWAASGTRFAVIDTETGADVTHVLLA